MSKLEAAIAGALSLLLLSSCGGQAPAAAENAAAAGEPNALGEDPAPDPAQPGTPANDTGEPVPPPDAVSHPNGYLPPAPAEPGSPESPGANSSDPDSPPRATEDQYIRNGQ